MTTEENIINILLIEDDPDDIELMESTINISNRRNNTQLKLAAFTSIDAAFQSFQPNQYDIILLDLNLGSTMGLETLDEVIKKQQQLPIIVLTGLSARHIGLSCIRHGASDYLIKRKIYTNQLVANQFLLKPIQYAIERNRLTQQIYQQKQKIEQSYRELQQLAFHASHDLKEPITTIIRFIQRFQNNYHQQLDNDAQKSLGFVLQQAHLQNKHIESLLKYLTIEQKSTFITKVELSTFLNEVIQKWKAQQKNTTTVIMELKTIPYLYTNPTYLATIFKELLTNALRFKRPQHPLQLNIQVTEKRANHGLEGWLIKVQDNGQGIAKEYHQLIFEMFKTLQPKNEFNSVGAGLALVHKMVQQLKGKIWVESELGVGSTFFVELPKLNESPTPQSLHSAMPNR